MLLKYFARRALDRFSAGYGYDVSYMRHMLKVAPASFFKFAKLTGLATHRQVVPRDAWYAAKLIGALIEDCGPCVQLVVNMARGAGVSRQTVEAILKRDAVAMEEETALAFRFADAVACHDPSADELREAVRAKWGDAGVIDLALAVQISRMYPMVKAALGYARSCERITVDGIRVDMARAA